MKTAQVRELKNKTSELLRQAAVEDVMITSRGRPVACLVGIHQDDIAIGSGARSGNYSDHRYRRHALRLLASFTHSRPDKGKKWMSQAEHDEILYGGTPG